MSSRYQIMMLKRGLRIAFFVINLFGLWSFRFVHSKSQIKYSFLKATYSIFVLCLGLSSYAIIGSKAFLSDKKNNSFFGSFTLRLVVIVYAQSVLAAFIFTYLAQHLFAKDIENAYNKCKDIVDTMSRTFQNFNFDFSFYLLEMMLKAVILNIFHGIVSYNNMKRSSDLITTTPYLGMILMIPSTATRLHMNIFYGAALTINVYLKKINVCLIDTVTQADFMNAKNSESHKYIRMENYCNFSDEIDRLSALYLKLVQGTNALNSVFSIHLMFWNATILLTLIVQFLFQFITIIELIHKGDNAIMVNMFGFFSISVSLIELLTTSYACKRITDAVNIAFYSYKIVMIYLHI